jgi:UPF0176 protein
MSNHPKYSILAYYTLVELPNPEAERDRQRDFLSKLDATCRIYLSSQGINGQLCLREDQANSYIRWMQEDERFATTNFKIHSYDRHAFPRLTIKVRSQLVALNALCDLDKRGESVSPKKWREMLEEKDPQTLILDVRNRYEWEVGHFEGAHLPPLENFREFPEFIQDLKEKWDPKKTRVMMYCTGGIRCELYSALLKKESFEEVYQLEGGIIKYGLEEGDPHWKGQVFVFDDRLTVPICENSQAAPIGRCHHCQSSSEIYYNCARMECNALFLSCPTCAASFKGCCSQNCSSSSNLRPFDPSVRPTPFRRIHLIQ